MPCSNQRKNYSEWNEKQKKRKIMIQRHYYINFIAFLIREGPLLRERGFFLEKGGVRGEGRMERGVGKVRKALLLSSSPIHGLHTRLNILGKQSNRGSGGELAIQSCKLIETAIGKRDTNGEE